MKKKVISVIIGYHRTRHSERKEKKPSFSVPGDQERPHKAVTSWMNSSKLNRSLRVALGKSLQQMTAHTKQK